MSAIKGDITDQYYEETKSPMPRMRQRLLMTGGAETVNKMRASSKNPTSHLYDAAGSYSMKGLSKYPTSYTKHLYNRARNNSKERDTAQQVKRPVTAI